MRDRDNAYDVLSSHLVLSAPQQIAAAIKREILQGGLRPGDKLPAEGQLAEMFGVSRPTIRAALQELCNSRILAVQRGRNGGYHVDRLSLKALEASVSEFISLSLVVETLEPAQFLEVRYAQELLVAELAAVKQSEEGLARLDLIHDESQRVGDDSRAAFELDLRFHRALAAATENPLLISFEGAMIAVLHQLLGDGAAIAPELSLGGVGEVVDAVRLGDPVVARAAMQRHLSYAAAYYDLDLRAFAPPLVTG